MRSSQSGWLLRHINISNDNGSFTFCVDVFSPLSLPRLLPDLTLYMYIRRRMSFKKQKLFTIREHLVFFVRSVLPICLVFCVFYYVSLRSAVRVLMFLAISASKRCSVHLYLQCFVWGFMSCLRYLCAFFYEQCDECLQYRVFVSLPRQFLLYCHYKFAGLPLFDYAFCYLQIFFTGEVHSIQHYGIKFAKKFATGRWLPRPSGFLRQ